MKIIHQLIILLLISPTFTSDLYQLVLHPSDHGAACLDGSPSGIYVHEGTNKNNLMIFFEGGGSCGGMTLSETT